MTESKKIFVSGSIAYDYIMRYDGAFYDAIVKEHMEDFNVSFLGHDKKMHFGGCAANIAYGVSQLGDYPVLYGSVGDNDFDTYGKWLSKCGIRPDYIGICKDDFTACAYALTDNKEKQIQIFSPGAMFNDSFDVSLDGFNFDSISYAILSPDFPKRTIKVAKTMTEAKVPYFFDPGPNINVFEVADLKFLLENAYGFIANDYEVELICKKLEITTEKLATMVKIFIETLGPNGCKLRINDKVIEFEPVKPLKVEDPTGCGDSFRSGLLVGLNKNLSIEKSIKMGSLIATYSIEKQGTQNHIFSLDEFVDRFKKNFDEDLDLK